MQARVISIKSVGVSRSYPALFHGLLVIQMVPVINVVCLFLDVS